MKHGFIIAVVCFSLIVMSCSDKCEHDVLTCLQEQGQPVQSDEEYIDYFNARTKWNCLDIARYRLRYKVVNQVCPDTEAIVEVENGEIVAQETEVGQFSLAGECDRDNYLNFYTIDDMFDLIEDAVDESIEIEFVDMSSVFRADRLNIEYDDLLGYPGEIRIDYILGYADEEITVELLSFEILD